MKTILVMSLMGILAPVSAADESGKLDLSTPRAVLLSFKDSVARRDWKAAERCLATDLRDMLKDAIADRTFFDQYVIVGFKTKTMELIPISHTTEEDMARLPHSERAGPPPPGAPSGRLPERFSVEVGHGGGDCPWIAICAFVREKEGYKVTVNPKMVKGKGDFADWYKKAIPEDARGRAKELEAKP